MYTIDWENGNAITSKFGKIKKYCILLDDNGMFIEKKNKKIYLNKNKRYI